MLIFYVDFQYEASLKHSPTSKVESLMSDLHQSSVWLSQLRDACRFKATQFSMIVSIKICTGLAVMVSSNFFGTIHPVLLTTLERISPPSWRLTWTESLLFPTCPPVPPTPPPPFLPLSGGATVSPHNRGWFMIDWQGKREHINQGPGELLSHNANQVLIECCVALSNASAVPDFHCTSKQCPWRQMPPSPKFPQPI